MKSQTKTWFHGTHALFEAWQIPPPPKPGQGMLVAHTALFLTSDEQFAAGAGSGLCAARLVESARVLDATHPSQESESLRKQVLKNPVASLGANIVDSARWNAGWKTGETLRFSYDNARAAKVIETTAIATARLNRLPIEAGIAIAKHNFARGLIELICVEAKKLGFDALLGNEVDQLPDGTRVPRPWLAVFTTDAITPVEWIRKPQA